ncbi:MAG TPA: rhomboid family intramembrane serine protease [Phycisphaerae bacterium]|nr:rhomboid family intramembrane serine protease [Phycisphaerae bacterium]
MSWQDREYANEQTYYGGRRPMYRGSGLGTWDVVTRIIVANIVIHFISRPNTEFGAKILEYGLMQAASVIHGEVWRLFTATYLHANFTHIFFNMLMLYFFGPVLEKRWGGKQFFVVYTIGGIAGNLVLTLMGGLTMAGIVNWMDPTTWGLGASGSLWAIMAAVAMYFPNAEVLVYFMLPVRIRTMVAVYLVWFVYNIMTQGNNYGGDICHLAGLVVGVWWARTGGWAWAGGSPRGLGGASPPSRGLGGWFGQLFGGSSGKANNTTFRGRVQQRKEDAELVNRILEKVYAKGINSLSDAERKALKEATDRAKTEEARTG